MKLCWHRWEHIGFVKKEYRFGAESWWLFRCIKCGKEKAFREVE